LTSSSFFYGESIVEGLPPPPLAPNLRPSSRWARGILFFFFPSPLFSDPSPFPLPFPSLFSSKRMSAERMPSGLYSEERRSTFFSLSRRLCYRRTTEMGRLGRCTEGLPKSSVAYLFFFPLPFLPFLHLRSLWKGCVQMRVSLTISKAENGIRKYLNFFFPLLFSYSSCEHATAKSREKPHALQRC